MSYFQVKSEFNKAVMWCLIFVWTIYTIVGDGGALLYSHDLVHGVKGNILQNLPTASFCSAFIRISMAAVSNKYYKYTYVYRNIFTSTKFSCYRFAF